MKIMFKNVVGHGELMLEHVFCSDNEPIFFMCINKEGKRFFCSCSKPSYEWLIVPVSMGEIERLLDGEMKVRDAFTKQKKPMLVTWTGHALCQSHFVSEEFLPSPNFYLDACREAVRDYRKLIGYFGEADSDIPLTGRCVFDPDERNSILALKGEELARMSHM